VTARVTPPKLIGSSREYDLVHQVYEFDHLFRLFAAVRSCADEASASDQLRPRPAPIKQVFAWVFATVNMV
jgi:hypothetical protein